MDSIRQPELPWLKQFTACIPARSAGWSWDCLRRSGGNQGSEALLATCRWRRIRLRNCPYFRRAIRRSTASRRHQCFQRRSRPAELGCRPCGDSIPAKSQYRFAGPLVAPRFIRHFPQKRYLRPDRSVQIFPHFPNFPKFPQTLPSCGGAFHGTQNQSKGRLSDDVDFLQHAPVSRIRTN